MKSHNKLARLGLLGSDAKVHNGEIEAKIEFNVAETIVRALHITCSTFRSPGLGRSTLFSNQF